MKKFLITGVTALSFATIITFSACSPSTSTYGFSSNWYKNSAVTTDISATKEVLTYDVTFTKGTNKTYSVDYAPGIYTVTLENTVYENQSVYKLSSELKISGTYTLGSEKSEFSDSIVSECYFHDVSRLLYPLYSKKTVKSTSPRENAPTSLTNGIKQYDYTVEITYSTENNKATSVYTDLTGETEEIRAEYSLKNNLPVLDNESLLFAIRGISFSASSQSKAYVIDPYNHKQETININLSRQNTDAKYSFINVDTDDKTTNEYTMNVNAVSVSRNAAMTGKALTAVYAAPISSINTYRCVMLQMVKPLAFNLGSLNYTLAEADFTNK